MRFIVIDPYEKTVADADTDDPMNVLPPNSEPKIVTNVVGLIGKDAIYVARELQDSPHFKFRAKGIIAALGGYGVVVGHTVDGEVTSARTSLKAVKKAVNFP